MSGTRETDGVDTGGTGCSPAMPAGMVEVSKEEFFKLLSADKRDIMPKLSHPNYSNWETRERAVWGWTTPGWRNVGKCRSIYAVTAAVKPKGETNGTL